MESEAKVDDESRKEEALPTAPS